MQYKVGEALTKCFVSDALFPVGREGLPVKKSSPVFSSLLIAAAILFACAVVPAQGAPDSSGWYTTEQAASGAKAYQKTCASCHGAKLEGAMGPALVGKQFWLAYGGKKISTLWSAVHTQMPMMAPGSVSARNSINIMAFLLQKNGLPSGSRPLDDTVDLSKTLPAK
jgi:mono/diheme cytochrome c family protein